MMDATGLNSTTVTGELPSVHSHLQEPTTIIGIVLLCVVIILIVVFNSVGLVVLHCAHGIQKTTKVFMASLTIADLCFGTLMDTGIHRRSNDYWYI